MIVTMIMMVVVTTLMMTMTVTVMLSVPKLFAMTLVSMTTKVAVVDLHGHIQRHRK